MSAHDHHPDAILETIRDKFLRDEGLSDEDFKILLTFCAHPDGRLHEAALALLLSPPATDVLSRYRHLIDFITTGRVGLRELPLPVWELLVEFVALRRQIPQERAAAVFFEHLVRHIPPALMRPLVRQSFPVEPFLAYLHLNSFGVHHQHRTAALKRRWRLLRKKLLTRCAVPFWAELTTADLGSLFGRPRESRRPDYHPARWLAQGRPLVLPCATRFPSPIRQSLSRCRWGDTGIGVRRFMDRLLSVHADELRMVRSLAETVSQESGRVVLSWHNATLAAAGGWAFDDLSVQFPSTALWETFAKGVQGRLRRMAGASRGHDVTISELHEHRKQRLVLPKVRQILWEDRVVASLDESFEGARLKHLEAMQRTLQLTDAGFFSAWKSYGWPGVVSPHQRLAFSDVLDRAGQHERTWSTGLLRLGALLQEGQLLLDKGILPHLVLPWIDKFFISSRREEDWEYLSALVHWFSGQGMRPLILFWEDTPHREEPSLKLVLKRLRGQGHPFRGIGVFDEEGSSRLEALPIIRREHQDTVLFALRPCSDEHHERSLPQLLEDRSAEFFQHYDSSWKDGLSFLYAGTQVFPLLAVPTDREDYPAWVAAQGGKHPFGSCWRSRLRSAVQPKRSVTADALSVLYARWANLC